MKETFYTETPIGTLQVTMQCGCVCAIQLHEGACAPGALSAAQQTVNAEIEEYFAGQRRAFAFRIMLEGTSFQQRVWEELRRIPFGHVATYGEIARRIGTPGASRAVGMACNRNPLLLAVPCHRVVGAGGKMTGFAVGIKRKEYLLELERRNR